MSEEFLSQKAKEALRHIRNWIMNNGRVPSVRELMKAMNYKSSRSALLLMDELLDNGFLQKKDGGGLRLIKDLESESTTRTVAIPLLGSVACGNPLFAEENTEAMIPVSTSLARPGSKYFLLRAKGDSMDMAGINNGDLILVKQQSIADNGQRVVALIDDEATVKEFYKTGDIVMLMPKSSNPKHQPIIVTANLKIQGLVVEVIPKVTN
jgi:repressor LexA